MPQRAENGTAVLATASYERGLKRQNQMSDELNLTTISPSGTRTPKTPSKPGVIASSSAIEIAAVGPIIGVISRERGCMSEPSSF